MTFEYDENNRISGFTLSISVPPYSRPTYSFVLDWEKQKRRKRSLSNEMKVKSNNIEHLNSERTIKDDNSFSSADNSTISKLSTMKDEQRFSRNSYSESEQKMQNEEKTQCDSTKNQTYDNLESYKQSVDNDINRYKESNNMLRSKKHRRNSMIQLNVIIRHYANNSEIIENFITDKVINSLTLIDALRFVLRNATISLIDNDYGRLYLFPDNKTNDKVHELRYDRNRYKLLAKFCKFKNECTLLLDLTNTFIK
uniref:Uncharacterized protein n=1 Tax=Brugia malayi TaxID=6279 RepID=A0A8L7SV23_BRUMA